jgi:hypothetical protein
MQGSMTSTQSFNNFFNNVTARSRDHQDLHAPNMGVNMSAIDNLILKKLKNNHNMVPHLW